MLHAQALKLLDEAKSPTESPATEAEAKKTHMSAISQLSTQIFQRAMRVEVSEIRVLSSFLLYPPPPMSQSIYLHPSIPPSNIPSSIPFPLATQLIQKHVTDIIYFIIAFAGVSLCRLLPLIPLFPPLKAEEYRQTLNTNILDGIDWLRSVSISEEHIASKFAEIIHGLHAQTLRRERRKETSLTPSSATPTGGEWWPAFLGTPVGHTPGIQQGQGGAMGQGQGLGLGQGGFVLESPGAWGVGGSAQQGFSSGGYDESYFVGLFPELMGHGTGVFDGVGGGMQGVGGGGGGGGFEDALGFWGVRNA